LSYTDQLLVATASGNTWIGAVSFDNFRINQLIGVARNHPDLRGADGVLGLGPVTLTLQTLTNQPTLTIPTVTQNLYNQGIISYELFSLSFEPWKSNEDVFGELTFGTTDPTKYTGSIAWM